MLIIASMKTPIPATRDELISDELARIVSDIERTSSSEKRIVGTARTAVSRSAAAVGTNHRPRSTQGFGIQIQNDANRPVETAISVFALAKYVHLCPPPERLGRNG